MEKVEAAEDTQEVFENDIELYLRIFCEENKIEDMTTQPQSVWNSALYYIYKNVFKGTNRLKDKTNRPIQNNDIISDCNRYDVDKVANILDIYIYDMCMRYDKEVSVLGFSTLTGIDDQTFYNWRDGKGSGSSQTGIGLIQKLQHFREESLSNKLVSGKQNPVGTIAVLNRQFGWASPYTSDSNRQKQPLTAAELPKLAPSNCTEIADKSVSDQPKKIV
nr:MAG TPA: DNA-packaging protein [Bacteriophage sp.]